MIPHWVLVQVRKPSSFSTKQNVHLSHTSRFPDGRKTQSIGVLLETFFPICSSIISHNNNAWRVLLWRSLDGGIVIAAFKGRGFAEDIILSKVVKGGKVVKVVNPDFLK